MYFKVNPMRQTRLGRSRRGSSRAIIHQRMKGLGDGYGSSIDWGSILQTGITSAANVAKVAVQPPAYSSVINPMTGQQSITSYAGAGPAALDPLASGQFAALLGSPMVLLLGVGLIIVLASPH